jgi:RHS repeat-associated protein
VYVTQDYGPQPVWHVRAVLRDGHWNVTAVVDLAGAVAERYVYSPYGGRMSFDGAYGAVAGSTMGIVGTADVGMSLGHQGLYHQSESLIYNRARFYHPTLGRFVQRDPLGYVDGGNLYEYVRGGPVNWVDPSGMVAATALMGGGCIASRGVMIVHPVVGLAILGLEMQRMANEIDARAQAEWDAIYAGLAQPLDQPKHWPRPKTAVGNCQIHHMATPYPNLSKNDGNHLGNEFKELLGQGGMDVNDWQNLCLVCNVGDSRVHAGTIPGHPMQYHNMVKHMLKDLIERAETEADPCFKKEWLNIRFQEALGDLCHQLNTIGNPWRDMVTKPM